MKKRNARKGFTMTEIIVVLTITAILVAVAVPTIIGFVRSGQQTNRMNVARTVYFAAQNRLTDLQLSKQLEAAVKTWADDTTGIYGVLTASDINIDDTNPDEQQKLADGELSYLRKPAGDTSGPLYQLLELVVDNEILSDAILIEFNNRTGVVLSVFYSDTLDRNTSERFVYGSTNANDRTQNNVYGSRADSGDQGGYEFADVRRQGVYGVQSTGSVDDQQVETNIDIYDSATPNRFIKDDLGNNIVNPNILYAVITVPEPGIYSLQINGNDVATLDTTDADGMSLNYLLNVAIPDRFCPAWGEGHDPTGDKAVYRYYWIIDYVGGDMNTARDGLIENQKGIEAYGDFAGQSSITVSIDGRASLTSAHPYYRSETGSNYSITSARHLYNIRYMANMPTGRTFNLGGAIDLTGITFTPIRHSNGPFNGTFNAGSHTITGLNVTAGSVGMGLFESVSGTINNLTLLNPAVSGSGSNIGAVTGTLAGGTISNVTLTNTTVSGGSNVGAVAGTVNGGGTISNATLTNPTVSGNNNDVGGVAGTLAGGTISNATLTNPTVSGSHNVGGVAGVFSGGAITGAYVQFTGDSAATVLIDGASDVGGLVGYLATGHINNSMLISPKETAPVAEIATSGGLVGAYSGGVGDTVESSLYLAVAPIHNGKIQPIVSGDGILPSRFERTFYLHGEWLRPEMEDAYNSLQANTPESSAGSVHSFKPVSTFELYQNAKSYLGIAWAVLPITPVDAVEAIIYQYNDVTDEYDNLICPYPYFGSARQAVMNGMDWKDWPLVKDDKATIDIYDSANRPIRIPGWGDDPNILYAVITVPNAGTYELGINGVTVKMFNTETDIQPHPTVLSVGNQDRFCKAELEPSEENVDCYYWIIDYVGGNMNDAANGPVENQKGIEVYGSFDGLSEIKVSINGTESASAAHPYYADVGFTVNTARHLYNVRYKAGIGATFTLGRDIGLAGITFTPIGAFDDTIFNGTFNAEGNAIKNLNITGSANDAGLFAEVSGRIDNLTLVDPSVSGGVNVGAVAGTLSVGGTVNGAYVQFTNDNKIAGTSNVGGLVGRNNGGLVENSTLLSSWGDAPVSGTVEATVGGLIGRNNTVSSVENLLYLAVAPEDGPYIRPIVGTNDDGVFANAYYLSGAWVRPEPENGSYNLKPLPDDADVGIPADTFTLFDEIDYGTDWKKNTDAINAAAGANGKSAEDFVLWNNPVNNIYPYAYSELEETQSEKVNELEWDSWPIVKKVSFSINDFYYYEQYSNGTYGTWGLRDGAGPGTLKDGDELVITEAGYVIITEEDLDGNYLFLKGTGQSNWRKVTGTAMSADTTNTGFKTGLIAATIHALGAETNVYTLPLSALSACYWTPPNSPGGSNPKHFDLLDIMYTRDQNGNTGVTEVEGYLMTLFAKGIFDTAAPDNFRIRTPWQMWNIGRLTARDGSPQQFTGGKVFHQDRHIDFSNDGIGVDVNQTMKDFDPYYDTNNSFRSAIIGGTFAGTYDGRGKTVFNTEMSPLAEGVGLFQYNSGTIKGVTHVSPKIAGISNQYVGGIVGRNYEGGKIESCNVESLRITGSTNHTGGIVGQNEGEVIDCKLTDAVIIGNERIGGITGANIGSIKGCGVEDTTITASTNIAGGIAGTNSGTVSDVYFLSMNEPNDIPIKAAGSGQAGGIVWSNTGAGTVENALYLAPAPKTGTFMYPIVGTGNPAEVKMVGEKKYETCFYLAGSQYSMDKGENWLNEAYNRQTAGTLQKAGGGIALVSEFMNTMQFNTSLFGNLDYSEWRMLGLAHLGYYPYPVLRASLGMGLSPEKWPLTQSDSAPPQEENDDWEGAKGYVAAEGWNFVNGDFQMPLTNPTDPSDTRQLLVNPNSNVSGQNRGANGGGTQGNNFRIDNPAWRKGNDGEFNYSYFYVYYDHSWVPGWLTRPVDTADYSSEPLWNTIEFQQPHTSGDQGRVRRDYENGLYMPYAELNAHVPGTLYQICQTTPGTEMYYSFYHASRHDNARDRMDFLLSSMTGAGESATYTYGSATTMRPCISPRGNGLTSATPRSSVAYGSTSFYNPKTGLSQTNYLYDVWVGDANNGYGITFWSTQNMTVNLTTNTATNIPSGGVTSISAFVNATIRSDAQNNVIGYWHVDSWMNGATRNYSEWKRYYGLYTVPDGQNYTEFAYQSRTNTNRDQGNYLAGVDFRYAGFASVNEVIKRGNDIVNTVQPGDTLTMEVTVTNPGDTRIGNFVISTTLAPYTQYFDYVGNVAVKKDAATISGVTVAAAPVGNEQTLKVTLPATTVLNPGETLTMTFEVLVRETVRDSSWSTAGYSIRNQVKVEYTDLPLRRSETGPGGGYDGYYDAELPKVNYSPAYPLPPSVNISDSVELDKTIIDVPASFKSGDTFTVSLDIKKVASTKAQDATGYIEELIPGCFTVGNVSCNGSALSEDRYALQAIEDGWLLTITDATQGETYTYELTYQGLDAEKMSYGVLATSIDALYKYTVPLREYDPVSPDDDWLRSVTGDFPLRSVGLRVERGDLNLSGALETRQGYGDKLFLLLDGIVDIDMDQYLLNEAAYTVGTEIVLCVDAGGTAADKIDNNYTVTLGGGMVKLLGTDLEFEDVAPGPYTLYYKIIAGAALGEDTFDLSSEVYTIEVTVSGATASVTEPGGEPEISVLAASLEPALDIPPQAFIVAGMPVYLMGRRQKK